MPGQKPDVCSHRFPITTSLDTFVFAAREKTDVDFSSACLDLALDRAYRGEPSAALIRCSFCRRRDKDILRGRSRAIFVGPLLPESTITFVSHTRRQTISSAIGRN